MLLTINLPKEAVLDAEDAPYATRPSGIPIGIISPDSVKVEECLHQPGTICIRAMDCHMCPRHPYSMQRYS